jgi:hypothetical protein
MEMKVETNVRAGKKGRSGGVDDTPGGEAPEAPEAPVAPPVSRCVGI